MTHGPHRAVSGSRLTAKGRRTRDRIREAALSLLAEAGYEALSMRAVANRAGVSVGNAYYYFPSKSALIRTFHDDALRELFRLARPVLERERTLEARLRGVLELWMAIIEPYHDAAATLFRSAADPESPFRDDRSGIRQEAIAFYREVVSRSSTPVPEEIRLELPEILWTAHAGLTLFWIHDTSFRCRRSRALVDRGPGLLTRIVSFVRLPGFGDIRRQFRDLLRDLD